VIWIAKHVPSRPLHTRRVFWLVCLALLGTSQLLPRTQAPSPLSGLSAVGSLNTKPPQTTVDPLEFSAAELKELHRRFGVHGPQPRLSQLFTAGLDQLEPLRSVTYTRLVDLKPVVLRESRRQQINPMLVMAVLFDELQHAKPGESTPLAAHSGLFSTLGPAQLGLGEMVHQGLLARDASPAEIKAAREQLLDPERNVALLVGKFARLSRDLGYGRGRTLVASGNPVDAKALAVLAYLHNGKLDYPRRILRYMQDPELHALIYGQRKLATTPLI
jgi:hypothetical protein